MISIDTNTVIDNGTHLWETVLSVDDEKTSLAASTVSYDNEFPLHIRSSGGCTFGRNGINMVRGTGLVLHWKQ